MSGIMQAASFADGKILVETAETIAWIRLNKPSRLNALDWQMMEVIEGLFDRWDAEGRVSVAVISSTSAKAFCAGADIEVLSEMTPDRMQAWELAGNRMLDRIQFSQVVSIAAINGYCFGGGCTLALACDLRLAAPGSLFAQPEIELGWIPGWGGVARLSRAVGPSQAKRLCMTGIRVTAEDAWQMGLVDQVVSADELEPETHKLAANIGSRNRLAIRTIKGISVGAENPHSPASHRFDALANATLLMNEASQTAIRKFREKKKNA